MSNQHVHWIGFIAILVSTLFGCEQGKEPEKPVGNEVRVKGESEVAQLPRIDLTDLKKMIEQGDREDRVLVIDFWATWCRPCVEIFASLHEGLSGLGDRVRTVTVTLDSPGELEHKAIQFLSEHNALDNAYLLIPDSDVRLAVVSGLGDRWQDLVVPAILVYDVSGELTGEYLGTEASTEVVVANVRQLIADGHSGHP